MSYYLHLSSEDSKERHPGNSATDFTVEIPKRFNLNGAWECSLTEIDFPNDIEANTLYVCCDLVEDSYVGNAFYPILRSVSNKTKTKRPRIISLQFQEPYYLRVNKDTLQRVGVSIRGDNLKPLDTVPSDSVSCTLHLRKTSP